MVKEIIYYLISLITLMGLLGSWLPKVNLREPYKSKWIKKYLKITKLLKQIKEKDEKDLLLKNVQNLEKFSCVILIIFAFLDWILPNTQFAIYLATVGMTVMMISIFTKWVFKHKESIKSYSWLAASTILSPFILTLLALQGHIDDFYVDQFFPVPLIENIENNWMASILISLFLIVGFLFLYLFTWILALPTIYSLYSILWLFNKYLKVADGFAKDILTLSTAILVIASFLVSRLLFT